MTTEMLEELCKDMKVQLENLDIKFNENILNTTAITLGMLKIVNSILIEKNIITSEELEQYFSPENINMHVKQVIQNLAVTNTDKTEEVTTEVFNEANEINETSETNNINQVLQEN